VKASFTIEEGDCGKRFVLTGGWEAGFAEELRRSGAKELVVNYARGFSGTDLQFLHQALWLTVYHVEDLSPVHSLRNLRQLRLGTAGNKTSIDFSQFPLLEDLTMDWAPQRSSLFEAPNIQRTLRRLFVHGYKGHDTEPFAGLRALEELIISNAPVRSLAGVSRMPKLRTLGIHYLRQLPSLDGVERLHTLTRLEIGTCRKIGRLDPITDLTNLRRLFFNNCGEIESIAPLHPLKKLEWLLFYEDTNILDGDLSPLVALPALVNLAFQNRKHYSHKCEDFDACTNRQVPPTLL
jgi:internalin A